MIYLESLNLNPYYNLAMEEHVFNSFDRNEDYFILWQNENTVVIGRYQNAYAEINIKLVEERKVNVARRMSGGGAVYHDDGNLNFTFITNQNAFAEINNTAFIGPVIETLKGYGIKAEFTGRNDLTIDGMKFCGNSQYIKNGRIMHHGCIMIDSNKENVSEILNVDPSKYKSKGISSVKSRITTINDHLSTPLTIMEFKKALIESVKKSNELEIGEFSEEDIKDIIRLRQNKYETWDWNFGSSPEYEKRVKKRFEFGTVELGLNSKKGIIQAISIYGDFFGDEELSILLEKIKGLRIDEHLVADLHKLNVGQYIRGMTSDDLYELIVE